MKKLNPEIKGLKVYCEKLHKEVVVDIKDCYWSGRESECESCGTHGYFSVDFKCECGKNHDVELNSW